MILSFLFKGLFARVRLGNVDYIFLRKRIVLYFTIQLWVYVYTLGRILRVGFDEHSGFLGSLIYDEKVMGCGFMELVRLDVL